MKSLALVFVLAWLQGGGGGVLASPTTTGGEPNEDSRTCTMSAELNESTRQTRLVYRSIYCILKDKDDDELRRLTTIEGFRQFFSSYCQRRPAMKTCLEENLSEAKLCLNPTLQLVTESLNLMLQTGLNAGCAGDGEVFAKFFLGLHAIEDSYRVVMDCLSLGWDRSQGNSTVRHQERLRTVYYHLEGVKECVVNIVPGDQEDLRSAVSHFLDEIRGDFRCIDTESNALVLCSSLNNSTNIN